jgi:nitrile hydratase accessory protein
LNRPDLAQAPIPRDAEGAPVFGAPWEAQAFAMAVTLHERGLFTWGEWVERLGAALKEAPETPYYETWLATLEELVVAKGVTSEGGLASLAEAWDRAAHATPHGEPILLANDPRARA